MQLSVTITQYNEQHATIRKQYIAIYGFLQATLRVRYSLSLSDIIDSCYHDRF